MKNIILLRCYCKGDWFSCLLLLDIFPFKRQSQKMVKHTQTIRRQQPTNCLSVFDHFVGLALNGLKFLVNKKFVLE